MIFFTKLFKKKLKEGIPAMWEPFRGIVGKSFFENMDELLKELNAEPEYKSYFQ